MSRFPELLTLCILILAPAVALADSCTAVPDSGPAPAFLSQGSSFSGPVVEVIDGDSICVAVGSRAGADWVEVRLADFFAPELGSSAGPAAKSTLRRIALGKQTSCVAGARTYDRIAAWCKINGRPIGDLLTNVGVEQGGAGTGGTGRPRLRTPAPAGLSCAELRARGGARRGEPGYRPEWDGDNDGIACEPYRHR